MSYVDDGDYRLDRGYEKWTGEHDYYEEDGLMDVWYEDHWAYGGECSFGTTVDMKYLDVENRIKLREELKNKKLAEMLSDLAHYKTKVSGLERQIDEFKKRHTHNDD